MVTGWSQSINWIYYSALLRIILLNLVLDHTVKVIMLNDWSFMSSSKFRIGFEQHVFDIV
jgi:hypothetical protein